jgi:hypothetical protein
MEAKKSVTLLPARKHAATANKDEEKPKLRVAAYCRVSTDSDEQATSYEAQIEHYTAYINGHPDWVLAGIYADDGISGTNTKKREEFNRMIDECMAGKIDMVITKSISRFARNTLDCLKYIRQLKEKNIPVFFEKENINSMDSKGEVSLPKVLESRGFGAQQIATIQQEMEGLALRIAKTIAKSARLIGELGLDFMVDHRGKVWFLEANPKPARASFAQIDKDLRSQTIARPMEFAYHLAGF